MAKSYESKRKMKKYFLRIIGYWDKNRHVMVLIDTNIDDVHRILLDGR